MKKLIFVLILLAVPVSAAQDTAPAPLKDSVKIDLLTLQRNVNGEIASINNLQSQINDLKRQEESDMHELTGKLKALEVSGWTLDPVTLIYSKAKDGGK